MEAKRTSASRWREAAVSARMSTLKQMVVVLLLPSAEDEDDDSSTACAKGSAEQAA
jgi:hypothetical protein